MAKKLSNEELKNVSGGGCSKHVLVDAELTIYFSYGSNGNRMSLVKKIKVYKDTQEPIEGVSYQEYALVECSRKNLCFKGCELKIL